MYKLRNLIGLPVLELDTGTKIGEVQEVVVDLARAAVLGIVTNQTSWFSDGQGILFQNLFCIGRDAVMVRSRDALLALTAMPGIDQACRLHDVVDKQIFTECGVNLGLLADIAFDPGTGEITAYEVSNGVFTDLVYGRSMMPLPQAQVVGEDKLIVPESMVNLLHNEEKN